MTQRPETFFEEVKRYVGFGPEDERALTEFCPRAKRSFGVIVDEFYAVIALHDAARTVFQDGAQVERLKASLHVWLDELLCGPWNEVYFERHSRIGRVHQRVGLPQRYMVTAMARVRGSLQRVADEDAGPDRDARARLRLALDRVCDIDLAVMLETYRADILERADRLDRRERELVETRLADLERFHRDALEASTLLLVGLDAELRIAQCNRMASRTLGYDVDELVGRDAMTTLFGEGAEAARETLLPRLEAAPSGAPSSLEGADDEPAAEVALVTRAGHVREVRWRVSRHEREGSPYPRFLLAGIDVTDERNHERRARMNERLAAAGTLAAGLAHEIRNPLNGASLHLAVLERAIARMPNAPPSAGEAAAVLRTEIKRLSSLVTDFLEVARPKPLSRTPTDLNEIVLGVVTLVRHEAESRHIELEHVPSPFPVMMPVDGARLRQALLNLVQNAFDAIGRDGRVRLRVRRATRDAEIDVEDTGPGIPDGKAPIFDAFYTTKDRGTGLGLSIVHRVVSDHGGDIAFRSQPGATVFTLRLPLDLG